MSAFEDSLREIAEPKRVDQVACGPERPAVPRVSPSTEEEWCRCLELASTSGTKVYTTGGGTKSLWHLIPPDVGLVLSTRAWTGVVAYEPADGTLTARSGSSMAELARAVAAGGHRLTPDVPHAERATLGGVLAAGQSGFDRLRSGGIRDAILGTRVLLANGKSSKSGGRLVKNVTGYDLHRLWCGSRGSLCVILEASLRLAPPFQEERGLSLCCGSLEDALRQARKFTQLEVRPVSVSLSYATQTDEAILYVGLGGRPEVLDVEQRTLQAALPEARVLDSAEAERESSVRKELGAPLSPHLVLQALPSQLAKALAGLSPGTPHELLAYPLLASAVIRFEDGADLREIAKQLRDRLPAKARLFVRDGKSSAGEIVTDLPEVALQMMRRLKAAYDPAGTFAVGSPV